MTTPLDTNTEVRSSVDLKPSKVLLKDLKTVTKKLEDFTASKNNKNVEELASQVEEIVKSLNIFIDSDLKDIEEYINKDIKVAATELQDKLNYFMKVFSNFSKSISFQSNFDGYIASVTFPAVTDASTLGVVSIQHFLGVTPKWRVILKQEGNGVLSDIPSGWNSDIITMKNNGSVAVTASILIARE